MKLKLKVSKVLKRELKELAKKEELERPDYSINLLKKVIEEKKDLWIDKVEAYPAFLIERENNLLNLREELEESEKTIEEQREELRNFYKENQMFLDHDNKKRKYENLILSMDDTEYYALNIIADNNESTIESFAVDYLHRIITTIK